MTIYTFPEPFETVLQARTKRVRILAYDVARDWFIGVYDSGQVVSGRCFQFNPPPPIPAAARKPKVGEVWIAHGGQIAMLLASWAEDRGQWLTIQSDDRVPMWVFPESLDRPATPQESEPFRPLLDGLRASLGEK